jgi:predicted TIM-barrel fold metal-dependent hydrolase
MNVIDFHTHIFPDSLAERALAALSDNNKGVMPKTNGKSLDLLDSMKKYGVTRSVLLPIATKLVQVRSINKSCALLKNPGFIPFGTLHPDQTDFVSEIEFLKSLQVKGIKFHPEYQNFYIDDPRYFPIYEALQSSGLITVFHAGKDPGPFTCDHALPVAIKTIHTQFPSLTIVAAHMGGWQVWQDVSNVLAGLPIYFDTAAVRGFLPDSEFVALAKKHGIDRILFGSDSPWYDQGQDIAWIQSLPLSQEEKSMILFENGANLLGLL